MSKLMQLRFDEREVIEFFHDLRSQATYPITHGDTLLLMYDLLCTLNVPEERILNWLGPRGYLHVARNRFVTPRFFEQAIGSLLQLEEDEHAQEEI